MAWGSILVPRWHKRRNVHEKATFKSIQEEKGFCGNRHLIQNVKTQGRMRISAKESSPALAV